MVNLRLNVHTPFERISISLPGSLYPVEATLFIQQILHQYAQVVASAQADSATPNSGSAGDAEGKPQRPTPLAPEQQPDRYVEYVGEKPWTLSPLSGADLHPDHTLFDNGLRDGDTLLFTHGRFSPALVPLPHDPSLTSCDSPMEGVDDARSQEPSPPALRQDPDAEHEQRSIGGIPVLNTAGRLSEIRLAASWFRWIFQVLWIVGLGVAAFHPQWSNVALAYGALVAGLAYSVVIAIRTTRRRAIPMLIMPVSAATLSGFMFPSAHWNAQPTTRLLISLLGVVTVLAISHFLRLMSLRQPLAASALATLGLCSAGLVVAEFTPLAGPRVSSILVLIGALNLLGAPRMALAFSRVKVPLSALQTVDVPLIADAPIDPVLAAKLQRARWLHLFLIYTGTWLLPLANLGIIGAPWTEHYHAPDPWQWTLIALSVLALGCTSLHSVYRTTARALVAAAGAIVVLVVASLYFIAPFGLTLGLFLAAWVVVTVLWLWATEWSITPVAQKAWEILEIVLLSALFPISLVACGLVGYVLSL